MIGRAVVAFKYLLNSVDERGGETIGRCRIDRTD